MTRHLTASIAALIAALAVTPALAQGTAPAEAPMDHGAPMAADAADALTADLADADGTAHGTITAMPTPSGIMHVTIELTDVPAGTYGAHLHQTGLCEGPDFASAEGHLAMDGQDHGIMAENGPHIGDMPSIHVPDSGAITVEYFVPDLTTDIVQDTDGTAFMLHAGEDDLMSQPAGDAGARMLCGVLAAAS